MRLIHKVAIVTGGASGIGLAIADRFREEGATVCVFDIAGGEGCYHVDVTKEDMITAAVDDVIRQHGRIDILVNNAGTSGADLPTHLMDADAWDAAFAVNVKGVMLCTKAVLPHMIRQGGGSIVNLSSIYGTHGTKGSLTPYHATKGAVLALSRQDAVTYGGNNIRVNTLLPGAIATPLLEEYGNRVFPGGFAQYESYASRHTPLRRIGEPKDVANAALFLASDEAKFITGAELVIDGGFTVW